MTCFHQGVSYIFIKSIFEWEKVIAYYISGSTWTPSYLLLRASTLFLHCLINEWGNNQGPCIKQFKLQQLGSISIPSLIIAIIYFIFWDHIIVSISSSHFFFQTISTKPLALFQTHDMLLQSLLFYCICYST